LGALLGIFKIKLGTFSSQSSGHPNRDPTSQGKFSKNTSNCRILIGQARHITLNSRSNCCNFRKK